MKNNGQIISKLFRKSVVSIILAAIATMLGIVIDGIVIGRFLGKDSMAAYGLVTPVINLATAFSGILATGAQIICAQRLGAGKKEKARQAFSMCMIITVCVAVLMMAVVLIFRDDISVLLGARGNSAHLKALTSDYLLGLVFSFPSVLFLFEFNSLMRLDGDPNRVIVAVVVMTAMDVAGDLVNALVVHGGMLGMGITTSPKRTSYSSFRSGACASGTWRRSLSPVPPRRSAPLPPCCATRCSTRSWSLPSPPAPLWRRSAL